MRLRHFTLLFVFWAFHSLHLVFIFTAKTAETQDEEVANNQSNAHGYGDVEPEFVIFFVFFNNRLQDLWLFFVRQLIKHPSLTFDSEVVWLYGIWPLFMMVCISKRDQYQFFHLNFNFIYRGYHVCLNSPRPSFGTLSELLWNNAPNSYDFC